MGATVLEEFVGKLGWTVDKTGPAQFKTQAAGIGAGLAKIAGLYTALAGLITGVIARTNAHTAAQYKLAKSLDVSFAYLHRWDATTKSIGIGAEGVTTAIGFLQKTLGNAKLNPAGFKQADAALKSIGLSAKDLAGKGTEDQFSTIIRALGSISDKATLAAATSKLFGRGSGMAFARLAQLAKAEGKTIEEYINKYKDLEFQTDQSVKGAVDFSAAWSALGFAIEEIKATLAGFVGESLTPILKGVREWIANNRELIKSKIIEWARDLSRWIKGLWGNIKTLGEFLAPLVKAVGGLGGVFKALALAYMISKFMTLTQGVGALTLKLNAAAAGASLLKAGLAAVIALSFADLISSLDDISNDSWGNKIARWLSRTSQDFNVWAAKTVFGINLVTRAQKEVFTAKYQQEWLKSIENIKNGVINFAKWVFTHAPLLKGISKIVGGDIKGGVADILGISDLIHLGEKLVGGSEGNVRLPISAIEAPMASSKYFQPGAQSTVNAPITINQAPGMSSEHVAQTVQKHLEKNMNKAVKGAKAAGVER